MDKNSIYTSVEVKERIKAIALPNQLPAGIDFTSLPPGVMKTSTLETLISQNEDLMARLSVSLRKNGEFENQVAVLERDTQNLRARFDNFKEQGEVARQKERLSTARSRQLQDEAEDLREQVARLERGYTELFVQSQNTQRKLNHLGRYRARVRSAGRGLKRELRRLRELRDQFRDMHKTTLGYEAKLSAAQLEVESIRAKAEAHDRVFEDKVQLENRLILEQRQTENFRHETNQQVYDLARETADLRAQVKDLLVERETKSLEIDELREATPALRADNRRLVDQVESLQTLWNHKHREIEVLSEKNSSLQKLNQNLGVTMNQQRKELIDLRTEFERERHAADERIRALIVEVQMLRARGG